MTCKLILYAYVLNVLCVARRDPYSKYCLKAFKDLKWLQISYKGCIEKIYIYKCIHTYESLVNIWSAMLPRSLEAISIYLSLWPPCDGPVGSVFHIPSICSICRNCMQCIYKTIILCSVEYTCTNLLMHYMYSHRFFSFDLFSLLILYATVYSKIGLF